MSISSSIIGYDMQVYPYQATALGISAPLNLWYGWAALAFIVLGGLLGIVGSLMAHAQNGKMLLMGGGVLALLSIIIFAVGLQSDLSSLSGVTGGLSIGLFTIPPVTIGTGGSAISYSTYLSYGFWLALASAIIMLVAMGRKPKENVPAPPPPQP
jgi:hypothetical protein